MPAFNIQLTNYDCGLTAFRNAMIVMGKELSWEECKSLVGTTSRGGTTKAGIKRGIESMGFKPVVYKQRNPNSSWKWLKRWASESAIICLVDFDSHWIGVSGSVNCHVIVIDPTALVEKGEGGSYACKREEFMGRWKNKTCYAIRVSKV